MGFPVATIVALGGVAVLALLHALFVGSRGGTGAGPAEPGIRRSSAVERWIHTLLAGAFLVGAATGLGSRLAGEGLEGWWLWGHMLAAPVFAVGLAAASVLWAERARFASTDRAWLRGGGGYLGGRRDLPAGRFDAGQKVFFWGTVAGGWIVLASAMATMVPVFGQDGQEALIAIHRGFGLALASGVILHGYVTLYAKPGTWRSMVGGRVTREWAERFHRLWWEETRDDREAVDDGK
jgi:formate dehydrogenase subunit gamma